MVSCVQAFHLFQVSVTCQELLLTEHIILPEVCVMILLMEYAISSILHVTPPKPRVYGSSSRAECIAALTCCSVCSSSGSHSMMAAFSVTWYINHSVFLVAARTQRNLPGTVLSSLWCRKIQRAANFLLL